LAFQTANFHWESLTKFWSTPLFLFKLHVQNTENVSILKPAKKMLNNYICYVIYKTIAMRLSLLYQTTALSSSSCLVSNTFMVYAHPCTQQIISYTQNNLLCRLNYSQHWWY
jgi:hypothetical protein